MAAALPSNVLECSICLNIFKIPKFLPCGHTFCLSCIQQTIGDKIGKFPCPLCVKDVTIPEGGAEMFPTNYQLQLPDTTQDKTQAAKQYCSIHNKREVEYYCLKCKTLICSRCFPAEHIGHENIDFERVNAKEEATKLVSIPLVVIKDTIENLKKTHLALLKTSENLKWYGEDVCSRISEQTERIITDIRKKSETVQTEIRLDVEQTELKLTETREKVMEQIKNLETNLPSLTKDSCCVQILVTLPKIKELEQLCKTMEDHTSEKYQYKDWTEMNFSVDIDMLGSVVTKPLCLHKLNHFRFNMNDFKEEKTRYYSKDTFTSNDVVWSCYVQKLNDGYLGIRIGVLLSDNPKLNYCIIDREVSLLNIDDDSKPITNKATDTKFEIGDSWGWGKFISWETLIDKNEGYISSNGQFVVQFDIKQVKELSFK